VSFSGSLPWAFVGRVDFRDQWDHYYVDSVRKAAQHTFDVAARRPPHEVYLILSEELRQRGIDPDPEAVFEGARLISEGRKPAVLTESEY
jgi:hypothetical protein